MKQKIKKISINLIDYYNQPKKTVEILSGVVEYINQSQYIYEMEIISFCKDFSNDFNYFKSILDEIEIRNIKYEIKSDFENVDDFLNEISNSDVTVNMRYHGSLISMVYGIPSVNIIYDIHPHYSNKMNYLAKLFNMEKYFINYSEIDKDKIRNLFLSIEKERGLKNNLIEKSEKIKKELQKQYTEIFTF